MLITTIVLNNVAIMDSPHCQLSCTFFFKSLEKPLVVYWKLRAVRLLLFCTIWINKCQRFAVYMYFGQYKVGYSRHWPSEVLLLFMVHRWPLKTYNRIWHKNKFYHKIHVIERRMGTMLDGSWRMLVIVDAWLETQFQKQVPKLCIYVFHSIWVSLY